MLANRSGSSDLHRPFPEDFMPGILQIAYKLLVNDRTKFAALLVGITSAVFLMIEMTSLFAGILSRASSTVMNIGASKLRDGTYQAANIIGLDDSSLFGRPQLLSGSIEDIFRENAFIAIQDSEFCKLKGAKIGSDFELNDHRGVVVGTARVASSGLVGTPTLYTTYYRALQYIPNPRFTISYVLVEPKTPADIPNIVRAVSKAGYLALTKQDFINQISRFYKYQTGSYRCGRYGP
jgi:putative ABC transport system permease protein